MTRHSNEKHENKVFVTNRDIIKKLKVLAPNQVHPKMVLSKDREERNKHRFSGSGSAYTTLAVIAADARERPW